jgi:2-alkenal reductase
MKMKKIRFRPQMFWFFIIPLLVMSCSALNISPVTSGVVLPDVVVETVEEPEVSAELPAQLDVPEMVLDQQDILVDLYQRVNSSVVNITIFAQQGNQVVPMGQGSGFLYDSDGHIVTNAHVIDDAEQVEVTFSDGTILPADIIGLDLHSDLAVVKLQETPDGVEPLPLGEMGDLAVGQSVVAIGNPFGLEGTLTLGIISALGRTIPALTPFSIPQSIQTDAAINPGNSGGPLLNLDGQVIGVNAQIETDGTTRSNSGVGFAIPVSIVDKVVPGLIQEGSFEWSWMGVQGGDVTPVLAQAIGFKGTRGAYLAAILPGGPADKAGLRGATQEDIVEGRFVATGGDIITQIDDQVVRSFEDLLIYIALQSDPGKQVILSVYRDGETLQVPLTLEGRPDSFNRSQLP